MAGTTGGKTRPGPDARTVAVKLPGEARAVLAKIIYTRISAGAAYDNTTQSGVIRDALLALGEKELGEGGEVQVAPEAAAKESALVAFAGEQEALQKEYDAMCEKEGLSGLAWPHFLQIRKLRMEKGGWAYGPN